MQQRQPEATDHPVPTHAVPAANRFVDRRGRYRRADVVAYHGSDRRRHITVRGPSEALLVVAALFIAVGAALIPLVRRVPISAENVWATTTGGVLDAVAIGFVLLAAIVLHERERFAGDAFSSRCGAALVVLGLGVLPFDLASAVSDSTVPLAFGIAGRLALAALLTTLAFTTPVASTVRMSRVALAGLATTAVGGCMLWAVSVNGGLVVRHDGPVTRPALVAFVFVWMVLALVLAGVGFRRNDVRYRLVVLLLTGMGVATSFTALDGGDSMAAFAVARGVRLVGVTALLYGVFVELRNVVFHERQESLEMRLETARTADRLIERIRHQEEVVHDARSALLAIEGGVAAVGRGSDRAPAIVSAVQAEIDRLRHTLEGDRNTSCRPFEVGDALQPMVLCYQVADYPVTLRVEGEVWAHGRMADTAEVVQNLVDNAIRHAESDDILVWVGAGDDTVSVRVADRGPGIPAAHRSRILERGGSTAGSVGGGLGLYTARRLIEAQSGTLEITDRDGGGTVFVVTLRRAAAPAPETPARDADELAV